MLSKNLIKASQYVVRGEDPAIVDTNELLVKKIEQWNPGFEAAKPQGFQSGLQAPEIDPALLELAYAQEEAAAIDELLQETAPEPVYTGPSPEELIAEAEAEIEQMRKEAEKNISFLKKRSMEEGKQQGYEEGKAMAMQELEMAKQQLNAKASAMEQEYQKLIDELEPQFIRTITGIYEEIFQVELSGYKKILSHAIANTIRKIEGSKDFLVHVSRMDYEKLMEQKEELLRAVSSKQATVELVEDATLKENECMIETNSGIFDCGIGTQLEELTRKLRLLSYEE